MKNTIKNEVKSITILSEVLKNAGLDDEITIDTFQDVIVLKNAEMTALEMINTIEGLEHIVLALYETLLENFKQDDECDSCTYCSELIDDKVEVPEWAKEVAGIDPYAKLSICVEEGSERIIIEALDNEFNIFDVTDAMQETLSAMGVCLGELNESIIEGEIIYGE